MQLTVDFLTTTFELDQFLRVYICALSYKFVDEILEHMEHPVEFVIYS